MESTVGFPLHTLCLIICRESELALRGGIVKHAPVTSAPPDVQDICQLWIINETPEGFYEIINAVSDYCLDEKEGEFKLGRPKLAVTQRIVLEKSELQEYYEYFWIRLGTEDKVATLGATLKCKNPDANSTHQLFRFQLVADRNTVINNTIMIENPGCGKVLDVPHASMEKGVKIIQWKKNGRFNQKWQLVKYANGYQIRSLKSGLNLDVSDQNKKPGGKIIQWEVTGASNQIWIFERQPDAMAPDLLLGVVDNSKQDGAKIVTVTEPFLWRIHGLNLN